MPRTPIDDRPAIAQYLIRCREGKGWTQDQLFDELRDKGIRISEGSYPSWETGTRRPSPAILTALAAFYDQPLPAAEPAAPAAVPTETERLIEALTAQTKAINELIGTLTPRLTALESEVGRLGEGQVESVKELVRRIVALEARSARPQRAASPSGGSGSGEAELTARP